MHVTWPQGIMAGLLAFSLARGLLKDGESDGYISFWANLFSVAIIVGLLWWGGFWR